MATKCDWCGESFRVDYGFVKKIDAKGTLHNLHQHCFDEMMKLLKEKRKERIDNHGK